MSTSVVSFAGEDSGRSGWRPIEQGELRASLLEHVDVGVASLDNGLRVRGANTEFLRRFQRSFSDIRQQRIVDFLHPSAQEQVQRNLSRLVTGRSDRIRKRALYQLHDGSTFPGDLTGLSVHEPGAQDRVVVLISADEQAGQGAEYEKPARLSEMDYLILEGLAAGVSTTKLAQQLYLSRQGIDYHVRAMLQEFRVSSRSALIAWAYSQSILAVESWPPRANRER